MKKDENMAPFKGTKGPSAFICLTDKSKWYTSIDNWSKWTKRDHDIFDGAMAKSTDEELSQNLQ